MKPSSICESHQSIVSRCAEQLHEYCMFVKLKKKIQSSLRIRIEIKIGFTLQRFMCNKNG